MPRKSADPGSEFWQNIREDPWYLDLDTDPDTAPQLYLSNQIRRVIGHNYVFDGTLWRPMAGSASGKMKTIQSEVGYSEYTYDTYSAVSGTPDVIDLGSVHDRVSIASTNTYDITIEFSLDGVSYGDGIVHDEYQSADYLVQARYVRISTLSGVAATGRLIAYV